MQAITNELPADLLRRVRGEFAEMPGLRLTPVQAARLMGLEAALAEQIMQALVRVDFLCHASNGVFVRRSDVVR